MSSSGGHYGGGDWGQSGDPWGQGGQSQGDQGAQGQPGGPGWQPTQEWGGGGQPPAGGPPQQGGWGAEQPQHPQQPPQQPPQQGWDPGQQAQQPGAWGAPGGDWQQQGQPQWGQPGYGQPPPVQKSNKGLIIGLSAGGGGLVLIIIIVLIAVFATRGDGGDGGDGGGGDSGGGGGIAQKWSVPVPDSENDASTLTAFVTKDKSALVRISQAGITGYDLSSGKQKFNIAVPGGAEVCAGTRGAPDGIAALVFGTDNHCSTVAAIDLTTGKQLWTTNFKVNDAKFPPLNAAVTAAAGKIYVATGERLIQYDAKAGPSGSGSSAPQAIVPKDDLCSVRGVAASDKIVVTTLNCGSSSVTLTGLSPTKLASEVFSTKLSVESSSDVSIVSASPLLIHVTNALENGELRLFDDKGTQTKVISSRQPQGTLVFNPTLGSGFNDMNRDFPFQIVGTTLVAAVDKGDNTDAQDQVAGINLQTGQWAWSKNLGSTEDFTIGVSADDPNKVFALDQGGYTANYDKAAPQSYLIDPAKQGAVTKGDKLSTGDSSLYLSYSTVVMNVNKQIILLSTSSTGGGKPLITAYGK